MQKSYCQLKDRLITHVPKYCVGYGKCPSKAFIYKGLKRGLSESLTSFEWD
jgi:hypothetical protein